MSASTDAKGVAHAREAERPAPAKMTNVPGTFVRSSEVEWQFSAPGVSKKVLREDRETGELALLLRFDPDSTYPLHNHPGREEIYALEGELRVGPHTLRPGDYLYTPPEGKHAVSSKIGALVLLTLAKPIEILEKRPRSSGAE